MMRCDIMEPEEQIIARYIGGLRPEISNVVQLQPHWTYNDVFKLAIKVERQLKEARGSSSRSANREVSSNRGSLPSSKPTTAEKS